jgi:hypothetical protein
VSTAPFQALLLLSLSLLSLLSLLCYILKDIEISNLEEGRALNSWLIGLWF